MEMEFYFWDAGMPFSSGFHFYQVLTVQLLRVNIVNILTNRYEIKIIIELEINELNHKD